MFRHIAIVLFLVVPAFAGPATAPSAPPTTSAAASNDAPVNAVVEYNAAMDRMDIPGMLSRVHATTPDAKRYALITAECDKIVAALFAATIEKFGPEVRIRVGRAIDDFSSDDARAATITVNGERARLIAAGQEVNVEDENAGMALVRVDGVWKTDTDALLAESSVDAQSHIDEIVRRGSLAKVITQDLRAGQFKSGDELVKAIETERARQRSR